MKAELKLHLDDDGRPCIRLTHYYKDNSLEQKLLKVFLEEVKEKGCVLRYISGVSNSFENYEIQIALSEE